MALFSKAVLKLPVTIAFPVGELVSVGWGVKKGNLSLETAIKSFLKREQTSGYRNFSQIFLEYFGMDYVKYRELMLVATKEAAS
jgi:hypothetical protein